MASITASMQALSLDAAPASTTPPQDNLQAEPQTRPRREKARRKSRPDQVDPRPLPPTDEWLAVKAAKGCMYYGFYADNAALQKMLINCFPKQLGHRDPTNAALLYPAILFLRNHFKRDDLSVHIAVLPQRAKDLNPTIEHEAGQQVLILGVFPLEKEAYLDRMSQKDVNELADLMGTKPTWWKISQLMDDV
ncbi:hypothetical protein LXA43DRAFT_993328 [Ganoderma leucocontextum]|nr:hypothetical protein LXA43DRAFT_993328 [Ganoderma leucocontextum]